MTDLENGKNRFHITEGTVLQAIDVLSAIPEFLGEFTEEYLQERMRQSGLILIAWDNKKPVACKLGYDRYGDGSWYSWLGGVLPEYRKLGLATLLLKALECWMPLHGYSSLIFKTRLKHSSMIAWAETNKFVLIDKQIRTPEIETRLVYKKIL